MHWNNQQWKRVMLTIYTVTVTILFLETKLHKLDQTITHRNHSRTVVDSAPKNAKQIHNSKKSNSVSKANHDQFTVATAT